MPTGINPDGKVTVIIDASPFSERAGEAFDIAAAMTAAGTGIRAAFFIGSAVLTGASFLTPPGGGPDIQAAWAGLSGKAGFPLPLCPTAAESFGITAGPGLRDGWQLSSLSVPAESLSLGIRTVIL